MKRFQITEAEYETIKAKEAATRDKNPIEQIRKQIQSMGFRNEVFDSLSDVMDR